MATCQHPDGCTLPHKGHGWCRAHLDRVRRTGDPGPAQIAVRLPADRPCKLEGCDNPVTNSGGYGWCSTHYQRWRKHGDPLVVGVGGASLAGAANPNWSGFECTYNAAHIRLRRERGRAAEHACVDCGNPADHWSYDNQDPNELVDAACGRYSADVDHYWPRCVRCHSAFDKSSRALMTGERP